MSLTQEDSLTVVEMELSKAPPLYRVIVINDDVTPMDFVVRLLEQVFLMPRARAIQVMLTIHHEGQAVCGVYTRDVAETKVHQVLAAAQQDGYPLQCVMEKDE